MCKRYATLAHDGSSHRTNNMTRVYGQDNFRSPTRDRIKHIIKRHIFLSHFLLCVLRDTYVLYRGLRLYPGTYRPEIIRIMH